MRIFKSSYDIKKPLIKPVVAIGNFDGVHLGHKAIFDAVMKAADEIKGTSVVYTLYPHPSRVIHPESSEPQINDIDTRLQLIENHGMDVTVVEDFNRTFSEKTAEQFFDEVILKNLRAKVLFVGYNFFFGKSRKGDSVLLKKLCKKHDIELNIFPPFKVNDEVVSSSKIRTHILNGHMKKANALLGRYYFLEGLTVKGDGRGKKIGIPTANIETQAELIPKKGVYITGVDYKGKFIQSVTNVGHAPTFKDAAPFSIETHFFNFNKDIYGESFILHFIEYIRDIKKFASATELVKQIKQDIQVAKNYFSK